MKEKDNAVFSFLEAQFPSAHCALNFSNVYECIIAVMLSAQTSDQSVNKISPNLFEKFPDFLALNEAEINDIENIIKPLGLYKNKAKNLKKLAAIIVNDFQGEIPLDFSTLVSLPGIGVKTANVVLAESIKRPAIAVDTHVSRVAKRLGYAKDDDDPEKIEKKLEKVFPKDSWIQLHHRFIFFGRQICHSQNPECGRCELQKYCRYLKKAKSTAFK